jgi:hypothetical protein
LVGAGEPTPRYRHREEGGVTVIGPDTRTRRIAEVEAVLHDLRAHPVDLEVYDAEVADVERELLRLLLADRRESS